MDAPETSSSELRITVTGGNFPHRQCPVSTLLPVPMDLLDLPSLYREGRKRPVPCQLEPTPQGTRLWWIVDNLAPGDRQTYTLTTGDRQRQATPRVTASPVESHAVRLQNRLDHGLTLAGQKPGCIVGLELDSPWPVSVRAFWIGEAGQPLPWAVGSVRSRIQQGPVFASVSIEQDRNDDRGIACHETVLCRLYDSAEDFALVDVRVEVAASTGNIRLGTGLQPRVEVAPRTKVDSVVVSPGWKLKDDRPIASGPYAVVAQTVKAACVLFRSDSFGFPPQWSRGGNAVWASVNLGPSKACVIPLGETVAWQMRILVGKESRGTDTFRDRYFDFDTPPTIAIET